MYWLLGPWDGAVGRHLKLKMTGGFMESWQVLRDAALAFEGDHVILVRLHKNGTLREQACLLLPFRLPASPCDLTPCSTVTPFAVRPSEEIEPRGCSTSDIPPLRV